MTTCIHYIQETACLMEVQRPQLETQHQCSMDGPGLNQHLESEVNELYLFHGSSPAGVLGIGQDAEITRDGILMSNWDSIYKPVYIFLYCCIIYVYMCIYSVNE